MRLILASEDGQTWGMDVSDDLTLVDIRVLLEAETNASASDHDLFANGRQLTDEQATLQALGIKEDDVLLFRRRRTGATQNSLSGEASADEIEATRQQILRNPELLAKLRETYPDLADAAQNDPPRFRRILPQLSNRRRAEQAEIARYERLLMEDPFNLEAQQHIEEAIRRQAVVENMEHAMEYSPESFGRVVMLYVNVEINGHPVKAFVDSGAQATIMSPGCAEACNLTRLIDDRWAGVARGVGTARILGRVHSAQIKVGSLFLACSLDILEGRDVDLLFGLDMLRRHQACIDLRKNALVIQDESIPFLPEHEIPKGSFHEVQEDEQGNALAPPNNGAATGSAAAANSARAAASAAGGTASIFPGQGNTVGSAPIPTPANAPSVPVSKHSEEAIKSLVALGFDRQTVIQTLDAAGGDPERAAALLFANFD